MFYYLTGVLDGEAVDDLAFALLHNHVEQCDTQVIADTTISRNK